MELRPLEPFIPMPQIIQIDPLNPDPAAIQKVLLILKSGGVIAYPTETFYGLGADACDEKAIHQIFAAKGRDFKNPIPLIIHEKSALARWVSDMPEIAEKLIEKFWPGPLTLVFQAVPAIHPRLTAETGKIGIRVSSHPIATILAKLLQCPVTATSANLSGASECTNAAQVREQLGDKIDAILDGGPTPGGKGSTIVDVSVTPVRVLREGVIPASLIL